MRVAIDQCGNSRYMSTSVFPQIELWRKSHWGGPSCRPLSSASSPRSCLSLRCLRVGGTARPTATAIEINCPFGRALRSSSAPSSAVATATTTRLTQEVDAAENQWRTASINHYRITVEFLGNGLSGPYTVEVQNGTVISAPPVCMRSHTNPCLYLKEDATRYTVPGLFALVHENLSSPCQTVSVVYDMVYGYPKFISVAATVTVADANYSYFVKTFMLLP